jgi:hypothetical protein
MGVLKHQSDIKRERGTWVRRMELYSSIFSVPNGQMAVWNGVKMELSLHLMVVAPSISLGVTTVI